MANNFGMIWDDVYDAPGAPGSQQSQSNKNIIDDSDIKGLDEVKMTAKVKKVSPEC